MRSSTWIAAVLTVSLWAGFAQADEDVLDVASDVRFREGLAFMKARKYEQARAAFMQTLATSPGDVNVLLNLALSEYGSGHYVESLGHLKEYLASPKKDPKEAQELKGTVYEELWRATGHLKIQADKDEAIAINGEVNGKAPLADVVHVKPGNYHVAAGRRTIDVTVAAGEIKNVNLASPIMESPKEAKENYWTGRHIAGVTVGGLAVVAAGLGIGFAVARESHVSEMKSILSNPNACADPANSACSRLVSVHNGEKSTKTAGIVSLVAAGALAAGAAVLLWPTTHKERARVVPTGQGLLVEGAF